jgi:hypothetical protein
MNSQLHHLVDQILERIRGASRFRLKAAVVAWLLSVVGWVAISVLPDVYEAQTRVYVDTRTSLAPVIQGIAINQDVNAQLNFVRQSLLGSAQLERLALETGQATKATTPEARSKLLNKIRANIKLEARESGGGSVRHLSRNQSESC